MQKPAPVHWDDGRRPWMEALLWGALWAALWSTLLLGLLALKSASTGLPGLSNDSFQYLSVADNTRAGHVAQTSLVQFDEERSHGVVPAPLTTFPAGYAMLVAAASLTGLSTAAAGMAVDIVATLGVILLLRPLGRQLGLALGAVRCVQLVVLASSSTLTYATAVLTEAPFTLALMLALTACIAAMQAAHAGRTWTRSAALAGVVLGAAYWLRYAGLFAIAGVGAYGALALLARRRWAAAPALTACAVASAVAVAGFARNIALVGSWRGGNTKPVHHEIPQLLRDFAVALKDLLLAPDALSQAAPVRVALGAVSGALLLAGIGIACFQLVAQPAARQALHNRPAAALLAVVAGTYTACLVYAASGTMISFGSRFFSPLLPLLWLLAAWVWQAVAAARQRSAWAWAGVGFTVLMAAMHAGLYLQRPVNSIEAAMAARLQADVGGGETAAQRIVSLAGRSGVIVATLGQAIGHVLQRPTVSLVGPEFSATAWDEAAVRQTVQRFRSPVLVVHLAGADGLVATQPSAFIARLAAGDAPPWLQAAGRSAGLVIYRTILVETAR